MNNWAAKVSLAFGLFWLGGFAAACPEGAEHEVLASWWRGATLAQTNACAAMDPADALEYAAAFGQDVEMVKALVVAIPDNTDPWDKMESLFGKEGYWLSRALGYAAAFSRNVEMVKGLVAAGADVNAWEPMQGLRFVGDEPDYTEESALHYALRLNGNSAVALALVHAGANPSKRDRWLNTPLHQAAKYVDDPAVISALLVAGADVNARNNFGVPPPPLGNLSLLGRTLGETPLMLAACCNANPAIAATLIAAGAQVRTNGGGQLSTPLQFAFDNPNPQVAEILVKAGARQ